MSTDRKWHLIYLRGNASLRTVVMHKHFEYLRNDLRQVDLKEGKTDSTPVR